MVQPGDQAQPACVCERHVLRHKAKLRAEKKTRAFAQPWVFPDHSALPHETPLLRETQGFKAKKHVPEHRNSFHVATLPSCFLVIHAFFSQSALQEMSREAFSTPKVLQGWLWDSFSLLKSPCLCSKDTSFHGYSQLEELLQNSLFGFLVQLQSLEVNTSELN